ncbi:MAG TPA: DNA/RNA nuclease SfsA [Myxococcales bacterium]|nr:DNA/RNA nuclease SfsA [Myxococcales bacterium]
MQKARYPAPIPHRWPGAPVEAVLEARPNRFLAVCRLSGRSIEAHVPDRGRCLDLLVAGRPVLLVEAQGPLRRTAYTVLLARAGGRDGPWVSLDPAGAPRLVCAALEAGLLPSLGGLRPVAREVALLDSRLDLLLADGGTPAGRRLSVAFSTGAARPGRVRARLLVEALRTGVLCEVKSVGAARGGIALFPDAPTLRGVRHLALLARRARRGLRSALVLCAQRGDVRAIAADAGIDPIFARALGLARDAGVEIAGLVCAAEPAGMRLIGEVPVLG